MRLSLLAALTVVLLGSIPGVAGAQGSAVERKISSQTIAAVEKELDRLKAQQKEEQEKTGLGTPAPSGAVAYLLLQGLAAKSTLIAKPSAEDIKLFALEPQGGAVFRLYNVNDDTRLVEEDHWKVDKIGPYHFHAWYLRVRKDGEWGYGGSGESTGPHKK